MMKPILSICISTYNRAAKIEKIVLDILQNQNPDIGIVVTDDCSTDDTIQRLRQIFDKRLKVKVNEKNLGPRLNWYQTIENGEGLFCLQMLDRDLINTRFLDRLVEILRNTKATFGFVGPYKNGRVQREKKNAVVIHEAGKEAWLEYAYTWIHPSGFLIKKALWDGLDNRRKYFEGNNWGIYPHAYVYKEVAKTETGISIAWRLFDLLDYSGMGIHKSHFYDKNDFLYWWMPQAQLKEYEILAKVVLSDHETPLHLRQQLLVDRFRLTLHNATLQYRKMSLDVHNCMHYNLTLQVIEQKELEQISKEVYKAALILFKEAFNEDEYSMINDRISQIYNEVNKQIAGFDQNNELIKATRYMSMYDAWLELKRRGGSLSRVLKKQGYESIAIYGNGKVGKKIYEDMERVSFFIDRSAEQMIEDIPVYRPEDELPKVDIIIVSILEAFDQIKDVLRKRNGCRIISVEELVYNSLNC